MQKSLEQYETIAESVRIEFLESSRVRTLASVDDGQQVAVVANQPRNAAVAHKRIYINNAKFQRLIGY